MSRGTHNDDKITELLLYVAHETQGDETAGTTKLNKILYFGELNHMRETGKAITGAEYQKLPMGPALRRMLPIVQELEENGDAEEVEHSYLGRTQKRLVPKRGPDLSSFNAEEIASVDRVISTLWGRTATEISEISHDDPGWRAVDEGDSIPLTMAFIAEAPEVTDHMRSRARKLAREQK